MPFSLGVPFLALVGVEVFTGLGPNSGLFPWYILDVSDSESLARVENGFEVGTLLLNRLRV